MSTKNSPFLSPTASCSSSSHSHVSWEANFFELDSGIYPGYDNSMGSNNPNSQEDEEYVFPTTGLAQLANGISSSNHVTALNDNTFVEPKIEQIPHTSISKSRRTSYVTIEARYYGARSCSKSSGLVHVQQVMKEVLQAKRRRHLQPIDTFIEFCSSGIILHHLASTADSPSEPVVFPSVHITYGVHIPKPDTFFSFISRNSAKSQFDCHIFDCGKANETDKAYNGFQSIFQRSNVIPMLPVNHNMHVLNLGDLDEERDIDI